MDQPNNPTPTQSMPQHVPAAPKRSLGALIKKYFLHIIVFFIVAITSGVLLANHEAKSTANWQTFTSKEAGLSFKHPSTYKIVEDKGWRITVYPSEATPANNIKILYSHKDSTASDNEAESTFLANCQATRVSEINANDTRIKIYEDSTCGGQKVENAVIVYSENAMMYDIGLFGQTNRDQLYQFLSTFTFEKQSVAAPPLPSPSPTPGADWKTYTSPEYNYSIKYPADMQFVDGQHFDYQLKNDILLISFVVGGAPKEKAMIDNATNGFCSAGKDDIHEETINTFKVYKSEKVRNTNYVCLDTMIDTNQSTKDSNTIVYMQGTASNKAGVELYNQILSTFTPTGQSTPPKTVPTINENPTGMTMCTMDAKICPDGTTVGRTGPNCEFVCPK